MNALTAALAEYADPRNWIYIQEHSGWIYIDDEPWARAQDALDKEQNHEQHD
jgi:hypothetical protein